MTRVQRSIVIFMVVMTNVVHGFDVAECLALFEEMATSPPLQYVEAILQSDLFTPGGSLVLPTGEKIPPSFDSLIRNSVAKIVPQGVGAGQNNLINVKVREIDPRYADNGRMLVLRHYEFVQALLAEANFNVKPNSSDLSQLWQVSKPLVTDPNHDHAPTGMPVPRRANVVEASIAFGRPGSIVVGKSDSQQPGRGDTLLHNPWTKHVSPPGSGVFILQSLIEIRP